MAEKTALLAYDEWNEPFKDLFWLYGLQFERHGFEVKTYSSIDDVIDYLRKSNNGSVEDTVPDILILGLNKNYPGAITLDAAKRVRDEITKYAEKGTIIKFITISDCLSVVDEALENRILATEPCKFEIEKFIKEIN